MGSELDSKLQDALKDYLIAKGIGTSLTNFLLHYLHKREQQQYVNWLKKGEAFLEKNWAIEPIFWGKFYIAEFHGIVDQMLNF